MTPKNWKPQKLKELGFVGRGKSKHRPRNEPSLYGGNYPFVQTGDIKAANLYLREYSQTYNDKGLAQSKLWKSGTLCITIAANIAETAILGMEACFPDSVVGFVADDNKSDVRFIKYYIDTIKLRMQNISQGTTQDNLSLEKLNTFDVLTPPLPTQRRIADILSTYDDLIENNTRRIHILEGMSQAIFQLWFGHVNPKSLPKGWKHQTLQEVADVVDCLHTKKPNHTEDGVGIFLQLNNIGENGKLDLSKKFRLNQDDYKLWTSRIEAVEGDCVITNVGRVAAVAQIPAGVKAALGRNMTGVRPKLITPTFLVEFLLSPQMKKEVHGKKDGGVIMDALNVRGIVKLELPIPPAELMKKFEEVARPIRRRIELMVNQNANLRQTRDLLLPRLVSGEIDVSSLS